MKIYTLAAQTANAFNEIARFVNVGFIATAFDYSVMLFCIEYLSFDPLLGAMVGYAVGGIISYYLNSSYTFQIATRQTFHALRFGIVVIAGFIATIILMRLLNDILRVPYLLSRLVATATIFGSNYILHRYWSFR